jgi:hypothetical protein
MTHILTWPRNHQNNLYIGPRGRANFNPGAFIWTNLVDTHLKMFNDKYLSSSCKKIFKFLLYTNKENQWPPPALALSIF